MGACIWGEFQGQDHFGACTDPWTLLDLFRMLNSSSFSLILSLSLVFRWYMYFLFFNFSSFSLNGAVLCCSTSPTSLLFLSAAHYFLVPSTFFSDSLELSLYCVLSSTSHLFHQWCPSLPSCLHRSGCSFNHPSLPLFIVRVC